MTNVCFRAQRDILNNTPTGSGPVYLHKASNTGIYWSIHVDVIYTVVYWSNCVVAGYYTCLSSLD